MTPTEYSLWAGAFGDPKSQQQLDRMKRMLSEVTFGTSPMDEKRFKDEYWSPYNHYVDEKGNLVEREFPEKYDSTMWFSLLGRLDRESIP